MATGQPPQAQTRSCVKCGRAIAWDVNVCPYCGHDYRPQMTGPPLYGQPQPMYGQPQPMYGQPYGQPMPQQGMPYAMATPKDAGVAAILGLILGLFGLWGIGHIYIGRASKGIMFLVVGLILLGLIIFTSVLGAFTFGLGWILTGILGLIYVIGWIFQAVDAYNEAKDYNRTLQTTGRAPW